MWHAKVACGTPLLKKEIRVPDVGANVIFTITVTNATDFSDATGVQVRDQHRRKDEHLPYIVIAASVCAGKSPSTDGAHHTPAHSPAASLATSSRSAGRKS